MARFQRILVATDFSQDCAEAFAEATSMAREWDARLTVLYAYEAPARASVSGIPAGDYFETLAAVRTVAEKRLKDLVSGGIDERAGCPTAGGAGPSGRGDRRDGGSRKSGLDRHGHARSSGDDSAAARQRGRDGHRDRRVSGADAAECGPASPFRGGVTSVSLLVVGARRS